MALKTFRMFGNGYVALFLLLGCVFHFVVFFTFLEKKNKQPMCFWITYTSIHTHTHAYTQSADHTCFEAFFTIMFSSISTTALKPKFTWSDSIKLNKYTIKWVSQILLNTTPHPLPQAHYMKKHNQALSSIQDISALSLGKSVLFWRLVRTNISLGSYWTCHTTILVPRPNLCPNQAWELSLQIKKGEGKCLSLKIPPKKRKKGGGGDIFCLSWKARGSYCLFK